MGSLRDPAPKQSLGHLFCSDLKSASCNRLPTDTAHLRSGRGALSSVAGEGREFRRESGPSGDRSGEISSGARRVSMAGRSSVVRIGKALSWAAYVGLTSLYVGFASKLPFRLRGFRIAVRKQKGFTTRFHRTRRWNDAGGWKTRSLLFLLCACRHADCYTQRSPQFASFSGERHQRMWAGGRGRCDSGGAS